MGASTSKDIDLENYKQELIKTNEKIASLNKEYIELTKELERLNGEKNILSERSKYESNDLKVHENITNLKEKSLLLKNEITSQTNDIKQLTSLKTNTINEKNSIQKTLETITKEKRKIEENISQNTKQETEINYKIKYLTDYIEQGGNTSPNVKKVLSNPKLKGIHNTISNLIKTEDKYLVALTIALGGAKDYIIVDTPENAKSAINFLKENNLGRVTFYPLSVIKPRHIDETTKNILAKEQGYIDTIDNIVTYNQTYQNIIKHQLGTTILVENIDSANIISKKINNRYRIITLSGESINVGGSITGGKVKTNNIISERYELQKLEAKIKTITNSTEELNKKYQEKLLEEKELQNKIFQIEKQKVIEEEELRTKEEILKQSIEELNKITNELNNLGGIVNNTLKDQEQQLMEKYYKVMSKKQETEKTTKQEINNKEKLETKIDELEASFRLNNTAVRTLENNLKEYEISNTKSSVKMDNLLSILSETYQMTFEKAKENYILEIDEEIARKNVNEYKRVIKNIGVVNVASIEEYDRINTRYEFRKKQNNDLKEASEKLLEIISELDEVMKDEFLKSFKQVQIEFDKVFKSLFGGGEAKLELTDSKNLLETGININVTPPGKNLKSIQSLSGGEKTFTAISLLFAILNVRPVPFCLFDEVEAALDDANVDAFGEYLNKYRDKTQFIIITHKKKTMEFIDTLYGITMQESGVSKKVSVKLADLNKSKESET